MKGIALVIGIDNYTHVDDYPKLNCAEHDAEEIAKALTRLKYEVECSLGDDDDTINIYLGDFKQKIEENDYDVAILYFAGHGEIIDNYDCMMLKNAPSSKEHGGVPALAHSIKLSEIANKLRAAGNQMNIIIMDACRKKLGMRGSFESNFGSMIAKIPYQTFLAFATSPGTGASDGPTGGHSPYTRHLLSLINEENLPIELLLKKYVKELKRMAMTNSHGSIVAL